MFGMIYGAMRNYHAMSASMVRDKNYLIIRVVQAEKLNFERGQKRSKMTFLGLKMIIFGHFSSFLASFKISFSSLQHPNYII